MELRARTFSREKNVLGELVVAYLAVRLASAVMPTWKKPVRVKVHPFNIIESSNLDVRT